MSPMKIRATTAQLRGTLQGTDLESVTAGRSGCCVSGMVGVEGTVLTMMLLVGRWGAE